MFHAQAERGLNGSLHPPECCHDRFRAKRVAALPHAAAPPSCSMLARRISLAPHPRYGCLIAEETSDAHPTGCRGERGPCFHRRRTSRAGTGRLLRPADPRPRRLSRRRRSGHRGAALRRTAEGGARAIRHRREPCRRKRNDRRRSRREVAARRSHAADGGLGRGRDQPTSLQGQDELRSAARACCRRPHRHRAVRGGGRNLHAGAHRRRVDRLRAGQSRQALLLLLRHRQSAAARRRVDEQHWPAPTCCTCPIAARRRPSPTSPPAPSP